MNPMALMEMGQVKEQESMREALRRAAIREARKQAGITWFEMVRARLFRQRGAVAVAPAAAPAAQAAPAAAALISVTPETNGTPVLVHEVTIRKHAVPSSGSAARATAPAPKLRVVQAAELDCVGADC